MKTSAGLLMYRTHTNTLEVLLVHPGGPFFAHKDRGVWSIPKGEIENAQEPLAVAKREFKEETGLEPDAAQELLALGSVKQAGGKIVHAWAFEANTQQAAMDGSTINSNSFEMEWPSGSGQKQSFPEVDRAAWFPLDEARQKINAAQVFFLNKLTLLLEQ